MIRAKVNRRKTWYFLVGLTSVVWIPLYLIYTVVALFGDRATDVLGVEFKGLQSDSETGGSE